MGKKRLHKSTNDKKICGVCAGVADYFGIDPTIVRIIWGILFFAYLVCAFVLPSGETEV